MQAINGRDHSRNNVHFSDFILHRSGGSLHWIIGHINLKVALVL